MTSLAAHRAPPGFPIGPVQGDRDHLETEVRTFTTNPATAGGGWGIRIAGIRKANSVVGYRVRLGCTKAGTKTKESTGCKWEVEYEQSGNGWLLVKYCSVSGALEGTGHNHPLSTDAATVMARRSGQYIPERLAQIAADISHMPARVIHDTLVANAPRFGFPITWTRETVAARFCSRAADPAIDMSSAFEYLSRRQELDGLQFFMQTDPSAEAGCVHVSKLFVELEGAKLEWARCGENNILLFDPTWGTNRYGLKLCNVVTVGQTGASVVLAFALISYEDTESILWAFKSFHEVFREAPLSVFTDGAASIDSAFRQMASSEAAWANSKHFYCVFHLYKNLWTHMNPLFGSHRREFCQLVHQFWSIAKESDWSTRQTFDVEWEKLCSLLSALPHTSKRDAGLVWLLELGNKKEQWAQRYVCEIVTYLVYSTQRCEALHRSIKQKVTSAKMRLIDIVKGISDYNIDARDRRKCDAVRLAIRHHLTSQELPPYLDRLRLSICPYAFELLKAQAQRVLRYHATPLTEDAGKPLIHQRFLVTIPGKPMSRAIVETTDDGELKCTDIEEDFGLKDSTSASGRTANLLFCSCQWDVSSGLDLCVHRMKIMTLIGDQLDDGEQILGRRMASKWKILTPEREQEAIMLLKARKAVGHDFVNIGREAPQRQTSYDRKRELLMEMRELAEFACVSDTFTQKTLQELAKIRQLLLAPEPAGIVHSSSRKRMTPDAAVNLSLEDNSLLPKDTKDYTNRKQVVGTFFRVVDMESFDDVALKALSFPVIQPAELVGKDIVVKWGNASLGGWHIAQVTSALQSNASERVRLPVGTFQPTHEVLFRVDNKTTQLPLIWETMCEDKHDNVQKGSWLLLDKRALHDDFVANHAAQGLLRAPLVTQAKRGRPRTSRFAPACGPTSSQSRTTRPGKPLYRN